MSATKVMKTKQYTVADVLHYAADKVLIAHSRVGLFGVSHTRRESGYSEARAEKFSCCAVDEAIYQMTGRLYTDESNALRRRVIAGLKAMGCNTGSHTLFKKYGDKPNDYSYINSKVQGMRYMWLKWAALMAQEQGV